MYLSCLCNDVWRQSLQHLRRWLVGLDGRWTTQANDLAARLIVDRRDAELLMLLVDKRCSRPPRNFLLNLSCLLAFTAITFIRLMTADGLL